MAHKPRILVVEDDASILRQLETTLKTMGASPRCLESSTKAAELINKEKFDGAFLDWDTPELNGEQLTKLIRNSKSNSKIPIAMITERHDTHSIANGFKLGVTFFLSKPVGVKELGRLLNASRGAMLDERRRYGRIPLRVPVLVTWSDKRVTAQSVDVSAGGLLLSMSQQPPPGTEIEVSFALPGTSRFQLKAEVVRTDALQVAVKFTRVSTEQREEMRDFIDRYLSQTSYAR